MMNMNLLPVDVAQANSLLALIADPASAKKWLDELVAAHAAAVEAAAAAKQDREAADALMADANAKAREAAAVADDLRSQQDQLRAQAVDLQVREDKFAATVTARTLVLEQEAAAQVRTLAEQKAAADSEIRSRLDDVTAREGRLDAATKLFARDRSDQEKSLSDRINAVERRELATAQYAQTVEAMKAEYTDKLAKLKALAG